MGSTKAFYEYLEINEAKLFTLVCLPEADGRYPVVIMRNPYVDDAEAQTEDEICASKLREFETWLEAGYAVVFQHCRGRGKSSGDCIPYINEREDGLHLHAWIRKQPFYNGELYLYGRSYTSSVHFVAAPFAEDIRGAVLEVQDCERYNCNYRNGFYKMGLHGSWYVKMYRKKSNIRKCFTPAVYNMLPLSDFSQTVFGEDAKDFNEILKHPDRSDDFWKTRYGGGEAHDAIRHARIPILLVTGFYDIYTGGVFDMWNGLDEETKSMSALVVHPFDHGGTGNNQPVYFENGVLRDAFGNYEIGWLNAIRQNGVPPFEKGRVTYYRLFGDKWCCDSFGEPESTRRMQLGTGEVTYRYNPYDPASFKGGLSANFGGNAWQDPPDQRYDIVTLYTPEFSVDTFIRGRMRAKLKVRSTCEDTCFYVRTSLCKAEGDYGLRDDINRISNFCPDYVPGDAVEMEFSFDEHAFVVHKGERIRIDISSSAFPHYVRHTNNRGLFSKQTTARVADNTVVLDESYIEIPIA